MHVFLDRWHECFPKLLLLYNALSLFPLHSDHLYSISVPERSASSSANFILLESSNWTFPYSLQFRSQFVPLLVQILITRVGL